MDMKAIKQDLADREDKFQVVECVREIQDLRDIYPEDTYEEAIRQVLEHNDITDD